MITPRPRVAIAAICAALCTGVAVACSSDGLTSPSGLPTSVQAIVVTPASSQLSVGNILQLKVIALDADGNELTGRQTFWASSDTGVATVSAEGVVTARRLGTAQIQAMVEGKPASSFISVVASPVDSVSVTPRTVSVAAGATAQLRATVTDASGAELTDRLVLWRSSNEAVARVTSTGLVSGVAAGTATITATSESESGTATVTVTGTAQTPNVIARVVTTPVAATMKVGDKKKFNATAYDAAGAVLSGKVCTWSSNSTEHATVVSTGPTTGEVTAKKATTEGSPIPNNTLLITATCEGVSGSSVVVIKND